MSVRSGLSEVMHMYVMVNGARPGGLTNAEWVGRRGGDERRSPWRAHKDSACGPAREVGHVMVNGARPGGLTNTAWVDRRGGDKRRSSWQAHKNSAGRPAPGARLCMLW